MIETDRLSLEPTEEQVVYETGPNRLDRDSLDSVPEWNWEKIIYHWVLYQRRLGTCP